MIYTKNCAKQPVEYPKWQNSLPKTDEMEAKRYATEDLVALDGTQDLLGRGFGLEYWEDTRVYAREHARVDIIRSNGRETHIRLHLLQFDSYRVAPANNGPFASAIDRHPGVG